MAILTIPLPANLHVDVNIGIDYGGQCKESNGDSLDHNADERAP
jgi:hypothetical protein